MLTLVVATRNQHKLHEIQAILGTEVVCRSLEAFAGAPQLVETAGSFAGNALAKAEQLATWLARQPDVERCSVLADDSGLEVDALGGAPGVRSARFAAEEGGAQGNASDAANNAKLLRLLVDVPAERRSARFRCVLAWMEVIPGGAPGTGRLFEGTCEGHIAFTPSGQGGFGYDPLFLPRGQERSFAELEEAEKNRISHRGAALAAFKTGLAQQRYGMRNCDHKTT